MMIVPLVLGTGFVAACIWLGVRIVNRREKWAKRAAAIVALLPLFYVVGFGPAIWFVTRQPRARWPVHALYWPIGWACSKANTGSSALESTMCRYAVWGAPADAFVEIPVAPGEFSYTFK